MSVGYFMDDIAIEYREEIEVLKLKDEAHTEARQRMASEIEFLTAENERLREILKPFALVAELDIGRDEADEDFFTPMAKHNYAPRLKVGDLRAAAKALDLLNHD